MIKSLKRLIQRLKRIHIENKGLKVLALLLAIILFIVSKQPISDVRLTGIPIEFRGLGSGMDVSVEAQQSVSVRLRGPRDIVRSLTPNQIALIANLNDKEPGERNIQFRPEDVSRPDNIQVLQIEPASIKFRIDQMVGRIVELKPGFEDQVPEGFEVYNWSISPSQVEIEGPQQQVREIFTLETEPIRLDNRTSDFTSLVDVEPLQHSIRVKTPGPITVKVEIGEIRVRRTFLNIPVDWQDAQPGYRLLNKTVDVVLLGPASKVRQIDEDQISARVRSGSLNEKSGNLKPEVDLPIDADKRIVVDAISPSEIRFRKH